MRKINYAGYRFPPEIIRQAIWLYLRFTLSLRDVEDLLAERGVAVSYETVRRWVNHFGPMIAANLRKRHGINHRRRLVPRFVSPTRRFVPDLGKQFAGRKAHSAYSVQDHFVIFRGWGARVCRRAVVRKRPLHDRGEPVGSDAEFP